MQTEKMAFTGKMKLRSGSE